MTQLASIEGLPLLPADPRSLAERFVSGDRAAFEEVVTLYQARVARLASRLNGWHSDVDDVVQDVFLSALTHARTFRGQASLWTWLTVLTLNRCRTGRRRAMLFGRFWLRSSAGSNHSAPPAELPSALDETLQIVRSAVASLKGIDREVIVLCYLEERSAPEVAGLLGLSVNVVEVRLHRARRRLKPLLAAIIQE